MTEVQPSEAVLLPGVGGVTDCDHCDDDFDRIIIFPPQHHHCPATECLRSHNFLNIQQSNYPLTHLAKPRIKGPQRALLFQPLRKRAD